ncbi:hypothetical protein HMPREF1548_02360 [Clostridium sp. KLE 1755]|nr:hypothetical protein HMPREF1548_02360 [Clostridium sp. KLE 1755]
MITRMPAPLQSGFPGLRAKKIPPLRKNFFFGDESFASCYHPKFA